MASQTSGMDAGSSGQGTVSEVEASDLPNGRLIGKGSCGIVYETTWNSKRSARKYFHRVPSEVFRKEATVLKELEVHENVVSTYDFTVNNGSCSLVLEHMEDDLLSLLQKWKELERSQADKGPENLPAAPSRLVEYSTLHDLLRLMLQISRGMRYLHMKGITHEDLKPRNVLVTYSNEGVKSVKVSDFGLVQTKSKSMKFSVPSRAHVFDMAQWKAPEILKSMFGNALQGKNLLDEGLDEDDLEEMVSRMVQEYSNEGQHPGFEEGGPGDVYSFAGTCFQILTGKSPYPNLHWNEVTKIVNQELKPILPDAFKSHHLGNLLKSCWAADPKDRPTFSEICISLERVLQEPESSSNTLELVLPVLLEKQSESTHDIQMLQGNTSKMAATASSSSKPNEEFVSDLESQDSVIIEDDPTFEIGVLKETKGSDIERPALLMQSEMEGAEKSTTRKGLEKYLPSKFQNLVNWGRGKIRGKPDSHSNLPLIGPGEKYIMVLGQYRSKGSPLTAQLDHSTGLVTDSQHDEFPFITASRDFDRSKFMRLFIDSLYNLRGLQLGPLIHLCREAHHSEEFFLGGTNQWVRTSITSTIGPKLLSLRRFFSNRHTFDAVIIHSNVLPCYPPWTNGWAMGEGAFPCSILEEAFAEDKPLKEKLMQKKLLQSSLVEKDEYQIGQHGSDISGISDTTKFETIFGQDKPLKEKLMQKELLQSSLVEKDENQIGQHGSDLSGISDTTKFETTFGPMPLRPLWDIQAADTVGVMSTTAYDIISLVLWRGGLFVRKDGNNNDSELHVVRKLSHPHIVYTFGVSYSALGRSLYMEYMQNDLIQCIVDKVRITGDKEPPFSHQNSVDILLQFAKAMAYMHKVGVVHCDLKPTNILISEYSMSRTEKHFLIKVSDFWSAQSVGSDSVFNPDFNPGGGTTWYAAPEVLKWRFDKDVVFFSPKKIDVYSFAIVAFEVLTGEVPYRKVHDLSEMKAGIIEGTLRPPLRAKCRKYNFLHDENLLLLIESCWESDPSKRPSFSEIVEVLESIRLLDAA